MGKYAIALSQYRALKKVAQELFLTHKKQIKPQAILSDNLSRQTLWRYRKSLDKLKEDGFLLLSGDMIKITEEGCRILENTWDFHIKKTKWDGVWRVIAYDIPEKHKKIRDSFRIKLKKEGFQMIQGSLWVTPYECKEEISLFANELGIANYVAIMYTDHIPYQTRIEKKFNLE